MSIQIGHKDSEQRSSKLSQSALVVSKLTHFLGKTVSAPLSSIFFISQPWIGAILWAALLLNPRYAVFSILGIAIGSGVGKLFKDQGDTKVGGGLKANALLAALMSAWFTETHSISFISEVAIASVMATAAAILAIALTRTLKKTYFPPLVLGYCIVAIMLFNICPNCTTHASQEILAFSMPVGALDWIGAFIQSLGYLIYSPSFEAGLLIGVAILIWSRIMFLTGLLGWIAGVGMALAFEELGIAYHWLPGSYNYFIAGMALGSVFILPGKKALLIAMLAGACAAFLGFVLHQLRPDSFTTYLPITAATTIWLFIAAFSLSKTPRLTPLNSTPHLRPEDSWWRMAYWAKRFGKNEILFSCPLAGELRVSQGVNGNLSHSGNWKYALDFQRPTTVKYSLDPAFNIWGAPIYAPASGVIEQTKNTIADNELGVCNYAENWGNYIIIRLDQGGWALLAHLQQNSIVLTKGMRVEEGDYLGNVGNSGRSPIPHLHLQAQNRPRAGATTLPFRLVNYLENTHRETPFLSWMAAELPTEDDIIMGAFPNPSSHTLLASISPGSAVWSVEIKGQVPSSFQEATLQEQNQSSTIRINTTLDSAGRYLFHSSQQQGVVIVNLAPDAWRITETEQLSSPFLKLLTLGAPSIPYASTVGMTWQDPSPLIPSESKNWLNTLFAPYLNRPFTSSVCRCTSEPNLENDSLTFETTLKNGQADQPSRIQYQFKRLSGPTWLQADFEAGSVTYTLLSFEPGLPLEQEQELT